MTEQQNENLNDLLNLASASQLSGYHQNYLALLCRQGILKGFKVGGNWLVEKQALADFIKTHKNDIKKVGDKKVSKIKAQTIKSSVTSVYSEASEHVLSAVVNLSENSIVPSPKLISLAEAGKLTGYHKDYLSFLSRTRKLKGFKIGKNWVTTAADLDNFMANHKKDIKKVTDQSGQKIASLIKKAIAGCSKIVVYLEQIKVLNESKPDSSQLDEIIEHYAVARTKMSQLEKSWKKSAENN